MIRTLPLAALLIAAPVLSAPPSEADVIGDRAALAAVLTGNWYPVDANGQPKPKSSFTFGKAACTAPRTAEYGADFSVRRGVKGLEISIGVGFSPATFTPIGKAGISLDDGVVGYTIYRLTDATDGSVRIWTTDKHGSDQVFHKCLANPA